MPEFKSFADAVVGVEAALKQQEEEEAAAVEAAKPVGSKGRKKLARNRPKDRR